MPEQRDPYKATPMGIVPGLKRGFYNQTFNTPAGDLTVRANSVESEDGTLTLYGIRVGDILNPFPIGPRQLLQIRNQIATQAANEGYNFLEIQGTRDTGGHYENTEQSRSVNLPKIDLSRYKQAGITGPTDLASADPEMDLTNVDNLAGVGQGSGLAIAEDTAGDGQQPDLTAEGTTDDGQQPDLTAEGISDDGQQPDLTAEGITVDGQQPDLTAEDTTDDSQQPDLTAEDTTDDSQQ